MFGIGIQEAFVILAVALLVLGPKRLPMVARTLGKGMRELRKASDDLRSALMFDEDEEPPKRRPLPPPPVADAPVSGTETAETANAAPGIHGSVAASAEAVADEDEPVAVPMDAETIVSRGQSGADPHKRALDPVPRDFDDEPPRHEPFAPTGEVPEDPDATVLLDEGRRASAAANGERRDAQSEKDVTT